jgi:hypothetical protein
VATVALRRPAALDWSLAGVRVPEAAGLAILVALSLALRTGEMHVHYWIDEGLSVGISSHALNDIPGVLRLDGSPPLYYLLLHVWMRVFGTYESATHALSLVFATLTIPAAYWTGRSLFDRRVAWTLAGMAALCPFLTSYAQESRMYSLVVLLGTLATAFFLHAFVFGRRAYRIPLGLTLAALLYTHNWAFFFIAGMVVALSFVWHASDDRRAVLRDAAVSFGTAGLLYLAWVPSLIFQALHTGAPWATSPSLKTLLHAPDLLLGGPAGTAAVVLAGGAGLAALSQRSARNHDVLVPALVALAVVPILSAWVVSQVSPAWATRYLAIAVPPLLILGAVALSRAGRLGVGGLALLAAYWLFAGAPTAKSNAHFVADTLTPMLKRGDLVISTQPEQVPTLSYYFPKDVRFATPFGVVKDTGVTDWRDGAAHFDRTGVDTQLLPLLKHMRVGQHVLFIKPIVFKPERWRGPWTSRVRDRSMEYDGVLRGDPRFTLAATVPDHFRIPGPNPLQGLLFLKVRDG